MKVLFHVVDSYNTMKFPLKILKFTFLSQQTDLYGTYCLMPFCRNNVMHKQ